MKKLVKVLALTALSAVVCLGVLVFAACSNGTTYQGEYHYPSYGYEYGIAVNVTVEDGKITKVEKADSDYVECSAAQTGENAKWTEAHVKNWNDNLDALLAKYVGKTVEEVKALTATIKGVEEATKNTVSDSNLVIADATQGSARVLKAIQNALSKI